MTAKIVTWRQRPPVARTRPNRAAGNFYRAASDDPHAIGGLPLDNVEATVTAAVRTGYRIAQAQLDRSARLARRLREAGDEATGVGEDGQRSDVKALDATEQLIFKGIMSGLSWFEGVAAEGNNPIKRLASAEFRLLGSMLGLLPADAVNAAARASAGFSQASAVSESARGGPPLRSLPQIRHKKNGSGQAKGRTAARPVRVRAWELPPEVEGQFEMVFFHRDSTSLSGTLVVAQTGAAVLTLATPATAPAGIYKGAVCDDDGLQLGRLEIVI